MATPLQGPKVQHSMVCLTGKLTGGTAPSSKPLYPPHVRRAEGVSWSEKRQAGQQAGHFALNFLRARFHHVRQLS